MRGSLRLRNRLAALALAPVLGGATLDGTWLSTTPGQPLVVVLRERADGRVVGYLASSPGSWITGGRRTGRAVELEAAGADPQHAFSATLSGTVRGARMRVALAGGGGSMVIDLRRSSLPRTLEHWVLSGGGATGLARATRVLDPGGAFLAGGFVNASACEFLGCGGAITSWASSGAAHVLAISTSGACPSTAALSGTWDPATLLLSGDWSSPAAACAAARAGTFFAAREGLADLADVGRVLELLQTFADDIEAESPHAADAFASAYLDDGATRADWSSDLAAIFAAHDDLEASIGAVVRIVTGNDADVNPRVLLPPRVEWSLTVVGTPAGGGLPATVLDVESRVPGAGGLLWIGPEGGRWVFVGNGAASPFRIAMPVAPGEQARNAYGLWPFGAHGGGHPEGHPGWDVEIAAGAAVRAAADGRVDTIDANGSFSGQLDVTLSHRPGIATTYHHITSLGPGIAAGATVAAGQRLGTAGAFPPEAPTFAMTHFSVRVGLDDVCPLPYLSPAGQAQFDLIWAVAGYYEELVEPFPCNPTDVTFPLTRAWTRTAGALAPRIDFTRLDPATGIYEYALRDAGGVLLEHGTLGSLRPLALPDGGFVDLLPAGGAPPRLGVYRIVGGEMWIDWGPARPAGLAAASRYATAGP